MLFEYQASGLVPQSKRYVESRDEEPGTPLTLVALRPEIPDSQLLS